MADLNEGTTAQDKPIQVKLVLLGRCQSISVKRERPHCLFIGLFLLSKLTWGLTEFAYLG